MGGLKYHDKKRLTFVIKKGNFDTFYERIKSLNALIIQEWIEPREPTKKISESGMKIVIILDNASFHKKKDILLKIPAEMPHIILYFLPA